MILRSLILQLPLSQAFASDKYANLTLEQTQRGLKSGNIKLTGLLEHYLWRIKNTIKRGPL